MIGYSSSNEDNLLRYIGPSRVMVSDKSFSGVKMPETIIFAPPLIFGEIKLYGKKIAIGAKSESIPFELSEKPNKMATRQCYLGSEKC